MKILTGRQMVAARALLDWTQHDLAARTDLSQTTIARIENGTNAQHFGTDNKIRAVFENEGICFIINGQLEGLIRLARLTVILFLFCSTAHAEEPREYSTKVDVQVELIKAVTWDEETQEIKMDIDEMFYTVEETEIDGVITKEIRF